MPSASSPGRRPRPARGSAVRPIHDQYVVRGARQGQSRCSASSARPGAARQPTSGGQPLATLAAPSGNDGAASAGTHPQPETVRTSSAAVVRLEGALAHGPAPSRDCGHYPSDLNGLSCTERVHPRGTGHGTGENIRPPTVRSMLGQVKPGVTKHPPAPTPRAPPGQVPTNPGSDLQARPSGRVHCR